MRQRAKLAQALVHDPEVLLLDEPLTGCDPVARAEITQLIQELGQAVKADDETPIIIVPSVRPSR